MGEEQKETWIIGCGGSDNDGVTLEKTVGTKKDVKNHLCALATEERAEDPDNYDFGTETPEEVEERSDGSLYAFVCFCDHHVDFSAWRDASVNTVELQKGAEYA